ncbi:MAG: hypothetical protein ACKO5K_07940 [Armatimonadota bacterium]
MHAAVLCPFAAALVVSGAACRRSAAPPASPPPAPKPPVDARATSFEAVIPDGKGGRIAVVRGGVVAFGDPGDGTGTGRVAGTRATLFRDNRPAAEVRADRVRGDAGERSVAAEGHVEVRVDGPGGATVLRSDTMLWRADVDQLVGSGHVLLRQGDTVAIPALRFRADARLRRIVLEFSNEPATGRIGSPRSPSR